MESKVKCTKYQDKRSMSKGSAEVTGVVAEVDQHQLQPSGPDDRESLLLWQAESRLQENFVSWSCNSVYCRLPSVWFSGLLCWIFSYHSASCSYVLFLKVDIMQKKHRHTNTQTYACTHMCTHTHTHTHTHMHMCTHTHAYMHTHTHTYTCSCTCTHECTHTHGAECRYAVQKLHLLKRRAFKLRSVWIPAKCLTNRPNMATQW